MTLNQLATFNRPPDYSHFSFSPDSRSLALFTSSELISWDIQTGGRLSEILPKHGEPSLEVTSFTYSKDGKMVAVACKTEHYLKYKVYTFNFLSRTRVGLLRVPDGRLAPLIWTHGEYLRFAIIHRGSITIWEVEFTLKLPPTQVESFPIPDEVIDGGDFLFLPVLYRLASILNKSIQVWDVKASKLLLESEEVPNSCPEYSFSSDCRFFACATITGQVRIWKESPAGYALHQQSPSLLGSLDQPLLSPNGRSIIFLLDGTINLWHTSDQTLSPPSPSTGGYGPQYDFLLAFSPNEESAAFAQLFGHVVTILDLRSGGLRLTIDTGMEVMCLGVAGDTVVVVDEGKIVTWNLPGEDRAFKARIKDSFQTVKLDFSPPSHYPAGHSFALLSLSPDLSHIAIVGDTFGAEGRDHCLEIHDVTTGTCLASTTITSGSHSPPWFTRDGREVWMSGSSENKGWEIIEGGVSGPMKLEPLEETLYPSRTFLWDSNCGYEVTDDGWVLSPTRKRLLWLPHRWRSDQKVFRIWSGRFLGLSHWLSGLVILEPLE